MKGPGAKGEKQERGWVDLEHGRESGRGGADCRGHAVESGREIIFPGPRDNGFLWVVRAGALRGEVSKPEDRGVKIFFFLSLLKLADSSVSLGAGAPGETLELEDRTCGWLALAVRPVRLLRDDRDTGGGRKQKRGRSEKKSGVNFFHVLTPTVNCLRGNKCVRWLIGQRRKYFGKTLLEMLFGIVKNQLGQTL